MNIIISMAGAGNRIKDHFKCPKPLIDINGKTLIERCIESVNIDANYFFITRNFTEFKYNYNEILNNILAKYTSPNNIFMLQNITQGQAESCLFIKNIINNDPLIILNCDQILNWNPNILFKKLKTKEADGAVTTYDHKNIMLNQLSPYAFIKLNQQRYAIKLEEKFAISKWALNGIFYWKRGELFVRSAEEMISNNDRVNGEFYVSKTFNYLIKQNYKIINCHMHNDEFIALGTTQEIIDYIDSANY